MKHVTCRWCGLTHDSPRSEVIHRGTMECVDSQACENRMHEAELDALRKQHHAEMLAFGERVREACAKVVDGCAVDESPAAPNYLDDVADMLRAVDVARLLEEDK